MPLTIDDERSKDLMFKLIASGQCVDAQFKFAHMLRLWFFDDPYCLARYLEWLDQHGLEIRGKHEDRRQTAPTTG